MIEELIYKQLTEDENIAGVMAKYNKAPAIFLSQAPQDTDKKWDKSQYPRAEFIIDTQYSPDRTASGVLIIQISCIENQSIAPEDITKFFIRALSGVFFTSTGEETVSALWKRTDMFEQNNGNNQPRIIGATLEFELLAFPCKTTINPDPVMGVVQWIKKRFVQAKVIGVDTLPEIFTPSENTPALYIRMTGDSAVIKNTYAVAWVNARIMCHIFTGGIQTQEMWARSVSNILSVEGEVVLADKSPLLLQQIMINPTANPLSEGQLTITGQYGVLKDTIHYDPLNNTNMKREEMPTGG